jgi:ketosteroid isomerase-like protein
MTSQNDEIAAFLAEWASAEQRGDTTALDRQLTDDFVGVGPLGFTLSKSEWVARHIAGDLTYDAFQLTDVQTRRYGDAAVATAHQTGRGAYRGNPAPTDLRAILVLVQQAGDWQLAGIHMSFIAGTPGAPPIPGRP